MRNGFKHFIFLSCTLGFFAPVLAQEKVGELTIDEVLFRPTYLSEETTGGDFSLADSSFKIRWARDKKLSGVAMLGSERERGLPVIYASSVQPNRFGFVEAYADYTGIYGRVRAGLLPLNFGHFGSTREFEQIFAAPILYARRVMGRRDYGVSVFTSHNGYYTELIGHNGEIESQPDDGNVWVTARWGWSNDRSTTIQMSAQTGRTKPVATNTDGSTTLMGWDKTQSALWRFGALSAHWFKRGWDVVFQITGGERQQNDRRGGMISTQLDLLHTFTNRWGLGLRQEQYDENDRLNGDQITSTSFLAFLKSEDSTSLFAVSLAKNIEERNEQPNDVILVSWRLTPYVK